MAEDGKVIYQVEVQSDRAVEQAKQGGERAGQAFAGSADKHGGAFKNVMIGAARRIGEAFVEMSAKAVKGVEHIAQAGIDFNAKMEQYATGFKTLLGSAEEAEKVMAQIREDAARTPFDVDSLTQANQMLISAGIFAGDARDDVLGLANAIAATGGGSAELSRMAANMQQVKNVGKATAMDIRQFAMAGINIYGLLADATGKTTEEVKDMEVSYDLLSMALQKAAADGGMYAGAMEAQSQTFNGRISTLKDNATQLVGYLSQDLFSTLSNNTLPRVTEWVTTLTDAASTGGVKGALAAAKVILRNLIKEFLAGLPDMIKTGMKMLTGLMNGIGDALPHVIETAFTVLSTLISGIGQNLPALADAGVRILLSIVTGLIRSMPQMLKAGWELIKGLFNTFFSADWPSVGSEIVNGIWAGIAGLWDGLVESVRGAVSRLWNQAKRELGIASPSKKFKYIGEMSVEGTEMGFEEGEGDLERTVRTIYTNLADTARGELIQFPGADMSSFGVGMDAIERNVSFNLSATGTGGMHVIEVPLYINDREFARATAWDMGEQLAWREV